MCIYDKLFLRLSCMSKKTCFFLNINCKKVLEKKIKKSFSKNNESEFI
jgi:hypothetical protein